MGGRGGGGGWVWRAGGRPADVRTVLVQQMGVGQDVGDGGAQMAGMCTRDGRDCPMPVLFRYRMHLGRWNSMRVEGGVRWGHRTKPGGGKNSFLLIPKGRRGVARCPGARSCLQGAPQANGQQQAVREGDRCKHIFEM